MDTYYHIFNQTKSKKYLVSLETKPGSSKYAQFILQWDQN